MIANSNDSLNDARIDWKNTASVLKSIPLIRGKGKRAVPLRLLQNLNSDLERKAEVLRWRNLTEEEQKSEKENLGYKSRSSSNISNEHASSVTTQIETEETIAELSPTASAKEGETASAFVGLLDQIEIRNAQAEQMIISNKTAPKRCVGSLPGSRAQVKDGLATKARVALVKKLYEYIAMTTLPNNTICSGQGTTDLPCLRTALVILDGFKPNNPNGGRWKDGKERREKPLLNICTGSSNDLSKILATLSTMDILSYSYAPPTKKYEIRFAYTLDDAIHVDNQITLAEDGTVFLNNATADSPVSIGGCSNEESSYDNRIVAADTLAIPPRQETFCVTSKSPTSVTCCSTNEDWYNQEWLNEHIKPYKGKGTRPVPPQWIDGFSTSKALKLRVSEWRRLSEKQQLQVEENFKQREAKFESKDLVEGGKKSTRNDHLLQHQVAGIETNSVSVSSNCETGLPSEVKVGDYRAVGSSPKSVGQIKDRFSRNTRTELIKCLFSYTRMTTPSTNDNKGRPTSEWPKLKSCLIVVDELKPALPSRGGSRKKGETWRRLKPLVTIIASSPDDWEEIFHAIQDGIQSGREEHMRLYDPVFSFNRDEANDADFHRFKMTRKRPQLKVLGLHDILPTLSCWNIDDKVPPILNLISSNNKLKLDSNQLQKKKTLTLLALPETQKQLLSDENQQHPEASAPQSSFIYTNISDGNSDRACGFCPPLNNDSELVHQQQHSPLFIYPFIGGDRVEEACEGLKLAMYDWNISLEDTVQLQQDASCGRGHFITITLDDRNRLKPGEYFNDALIDFFMRWMCRKEAQIASCIFCFTSHFYSTLRDRGAHAISHYTSRQQNIDIFSKRMVFLPVNGDLHWSLCVVVNPGLVENMEIAAENRNIEVPCIIILDPHKAHNKDIIAHHVRSWLNQEWRKIKNVENGIFTACTIGVYTPKVPYQNNSWDCGAFVCKYAYALYQQRHRRITYNDLFEKDPLVDAVTNSPHMNFGIDDIVEFREEMCKLVENLSHVYMEVKG